MSRSRRRHTRGRVLLWAAPLEASYQTVTSWGTGYPGQYTSTDAGTAAVNRWTLTFQRPGSTSVSDREESPR